MNKKYGVVLALVLIIIAAIGLIIMQSMGGKKNSNDTSNSVQSAVKSENAYLLEGYPQDIVPLYKLEKVSSNKIFVNTDPKNTSSFGNANFAYFNVVFDSTASQEEFLNYYKNLFESEITEEFSPPDMVKGVIGEYKVTAAHYGGGNTGYVQVHLADHNDERLNKYFEDFPEFFEEGEYLTEHEKSFGLLNQKGGEKEFTKYYTVANSGDQDNDSKDDVDEFAVLENKYKQLYANEPEYQYDEKSGTMKWKSQEYQVTMSISRDHGRIYLMMRKNMG